MADPTRAQLNRLLESIDARFREAFELYVQTVKSPAVMRAIIARLEAGDVEGALAIVQAHVKSMGAVVSRAFQAAAEAAAAEAAKQIMALEPALGFGFDPTHPRAAEIVRREAAGFIREIGTKQADAIRYAISEGFEAGAGTQAKARAFRNAIGLTRTQLQAVENYRELLGGLSPEALDRDLRDRRFDGTVRRAIRDGKPLRAAEIERMTDRYRQRFVSYRADMIARTESVRATSMAREETYRQLVESGIGHNRIMRVWNSTRDGRTRDWHRTMNGQERPIGSAFLDGKGRALLYPGDPNAPADSTINCRCVLTLRIVPAQ